MKKLQIALAVMALGGALAAAPASAITITNGDLTNATVERHRLGFGRYGVHDGLHRHARQHIHADVLRVGRVA